MKQKGFTLLETMISISIFSVLMLIVFGCWSEFQKVSTKNEGKQDTNISFVNVYRNIDKLISSSNTRLIKCYKDTDLGLEHTDLRWFAFLLSREKDAFGRATLDGKPQYEHLAPPDSDIDTNLLIYNTCVLYLLHSPDDNCGGFDKCPHKSLRRYVFNTDEVTPPPNVVHFGKSNLLNDVFKEKVLKNQVSAILNDQNSKSFSVIENNIVDLTIRKEDYKLRFYLRLLRINDLQRTSDGRKTFQIGTKQLTQQNLPTGKYEYDITDNVVKHYIENLSWISIPSNT